MSQDNDKQGVLIDVLPEPPEDASVDQAEPDQQPDKPKQGGGFPLGVVLAVLALVAVGVAGYFGQQSLDSLKGAMNGMDQSLAQAMNQQKQFESDLAEAQQVVAKEAQRLADERARLEAQADSMRTQSAEMRVQADRLDAARTELEAREVELQAAVNDVYSRMGGSDDQWLVAEAEFLLRLAEEKMRLAKDDITAAAALSLADERLKATGDTGWAGVRQQIALDLAATTDFVKPDIAGMSGRLNAMVERIPKLKLNKELVTSRRMAGPRMPERDRDERTWENLANDLWQGIRNSVRFQQHDRKVEAMLAPKEQYLLYESLRIHLESARLAMLREDDVLYQEALGRARETLEKYFDILDDHSIAFLVNLKALTKIGLKAEAPDISKSLRVLEGRRKILSERQPLLNVAPTPVTAVPVPAPVAVPAAPPAPASVPEPVSAPTTAPASQIAETSDDSVEVVTDQANDEPIEEANGDSVEEPVEEPGEAAMDAPTVEDEAEVDAATEPEPEAES